MEGTFSLKIYLSPIPTIVKNKFYGSKHGWGTQKDCLILYSLGPLT